MYVCSVDSCDSELMIDCAETLYTYIFVWMAMHEYLCDDILNFLNDNLLKVPTVFELFL